MFHDVESVCGQYRHVWGQLPAFRSAFEHLKSKLMELDDLISNHRRHTGGAAQDKVTARHELCALSFEIAAAIRASASAAGDAKAAAKVFFSVTQLRTGKDELCLERCRQILATARNQQLHLEAFGVTETRIADLSQALKRFSEAIERTRNLRNANKSVTGHLPDAFAKVEQVIYEQLDNLMPQFRTTAPRFYNQYRDNRVMKSARKQIATVSDWQTEEPPMLD
jgi:hypothetical protein